MITLSAYTALLVQREGGIKDIGDGKGVTSYGQTLDWLREFLLPTPTTPAEAATNYLHWIHDTGLYHILTPDMMVDDLADIVIDISVMSSHEKGIMALQASLHLPQDGILGTQTLSALVIANRNQLARDVIAWDMEFQGRIITHDPVKLARWAGGWAARLAQHVRDLS